MCFKYDDTDNIRIKDNAGNNTGYTDNTEDITKYTEIAENTDITDCTNNI